MPRTNELKMTWRMDLGGSLVAIWHGEKTRLNFAGICPKSENDNTLEPNRRGSEIKRHCLVLLSLLLIPTAAMPQRYGRPYNLVGNPQLLLQVSVQKKSQYFGIPDLTKMPHSAVTGTDPATNVTHVYEGVALEQLVPDMALESGGASIEIEFGSHQTLTISVAELDTWAKPILADKVDGKPLSGYAPYALVAKSSHEYLLIFPGAQRIAVKLPHQTSPALVNTSN